MVATVLFNQMYLLQMLWWIKTTLEFSYRSAEAYACGKISHQHGYVRNLIAVCLHYVLYKRQKGKQLNLSNQGKFLWVLSRHQENKFSLFAYCHFESSGSNFWLLHIQDWMELAITVHLIFLNEKESYFDQSFPFTFSDRGHKIKCKVKAYTRKVYLYKYYFTIKNILRWHRFTYYSAQSLYWRSPIVVLS